MREGKAAREVCLLCCLLACASPPGSSQSAPASADLPTFDAATIKPPDPGAAGRMAGFYSQPGGRIFFGGHVKWLIEIAFDLRDYQVGRGPGWIDSQWFEINAVPPETSASRSNRVRSTEPTPDQRLMLQSLLRDRFGLKFHFETKEGETRILVRGSKPLQLKQPKDPASNPWIFVATKPGGIVDGEAAGANTTMDYFAQRLGGYLRLPVLNETGISGSYDFDLPPDDPENTDIVSAVNSVVDRLGLKLKSGHGPIQTLVIDHIEQPSEN